MSEPNREHTKNIFEMWAKQNGYKETIPILLSPLDAYYNPDIPNDFHDRPKIDHPFLFSIINGLDEKQTGKYLTQLMGLLDSEYHYPHDTPLAEYLPGETIKIHTAEPEQILEALFALSNG